MDFRRILFFAVFSLAILAGYIDYISGAKVSMMLIYVVPVLVASRFCGKNEGIVIAIISAIGWFVANLRHAKVNETIITWDAVSRLGIFALISYAVSLQTALKESLAREQLNARTDRLTGILNKWAFNNQVQHEILRARRYHHPLSLAFIDLDNFKSINDIYGHAEGDRLLRDVSTAMQHAMRETDLAGRIGGDEFCICLPETGPGAIHEAIEKLLKKLDILTQQYNLKVTASVGVISYNAVADDFDDIVNKADQLMYKAKELGKNRAEFLIIE